MPGGTGSTATRRTERSEEKRTPASPAPPGLVVRPAGTPEPATPTVWTTLRDDLVFQITLAVLAVLLVPYVTPVVTAGQLEILAESYSDIVLIGLTIFAILYQLGRIEHEEERRFWSFLALALGFWLAVRIYYVALTNTLSSTSEYIAADVLYLSFYVSVVLAAETKPHLSAGWSSADLGYRFQSAGAIAVASGLLIYFVFVPSAMNPEAYAGWLPSLYLYLALDCYLLVRFGSLALRCMTERWRVLYGLFSLTAALWAVTDLGECLSYAGVLDFRSGMALDLVWWVPFITMVLAARLRNHPFSRDRRASTETTPSGRPWPVVSPLLLFAFALPVMHFGLHALGLLDQESRATRESVVLGCLVVLGGLALVHQRLLEKTNRALVSDLESAKDRLQQAQKLEALGRLAGGIAHDFNNLLTAIMGHSELLLTRLDGHEELREDVEAVKKAGDRAASLTRQLLAFGRQQVIRPKVLDLNTVVAESDQMLRRLIREDLEVVMALDPAPACVRADPDQIHRVIINLTVNAADAMTGGGRLTIKTANVDLGDAPDARARGVQPGSYAILAVSDTGAGMDGDTQARVFEPFFTTKEPGRGTGLGLSTVYGIVQQSGGNVCVTSSPGHGTTFTVYLPRVEDAADPVEPSDAPGDERRGSETILLVEDEDAVRELARDILKQNGYHVLEAAEGVTAVGLSQRYAGQIHLLLTDMVMPGPSGRELARQLAPIRPGMRVLYISGYTDEAIANHDGSDRGTAFLQKPFSPASLASRVRKILDAR